MKGTVAREVGGHDALEQGITGRVTAYEPLRLLEYTWDEPDAPHGAIAGALVRFDLAQEGERVRLTLTGIRMHMGPEVPQRAAKAFAEARPDAIKRMAL